MTIEANEISCEAKVNTDDKSYPTGIQWYNEEDESLQLDFNNKIIVSTVVIMTSTFSLKNINQDTQATVTCCTTIDDTPYNCTSVILKSPPPSTTRTTKQTTATTKSTITTKPNTGNTFKISATLLIFSKLLLFL